jgi:hypothetical protein
VRNVTISLDEETARWARVEAARHDTSVSRWIGELLEERRRNAFDYERARRSYLYRPATPLKQPGKSLPTRDDVHDRSA